MMEQTFAPFFHSRGANRFPHEGGMVHPDLPLGLDLGLGSARYTPTSQTQSFNGLH